MTDYPKKGLRLRSASSSWKKREDARKWHSLVGIFTTIVLLLAVVNGVFKTLSFSKHFSKPSWDGKSSFAVALSTTPTSVLIYSPNSKELNLVALGGELYIPTGETDKPIGRVAELSEDTQKLAMVASTVTRAPIKNYVVFDRELTADEVNFQQVFKGFASLATPVALFIFGPSGVVDTNISRTDMISLWWQVKSLSIDELNFVPLGAYSQDIVMSNGAKVLGVDSASVLKTVSKYMENREVLESSLEIEIVDASGDANNLRLASDFVTSIGGRVVAEKESEVTTAITSIAAQDDDSYTAAYLAKLFDCDINQVPSLAKDQLRVVLGEDFGKRF